MRTLIVGLGCAVPDRAVAQEQALALSHELSPPASDEQRRQTDIIYRRSGVRQRGSALPLPGAHGALLTPSTLSGLRGPGTHARLEAYERGARSLSLAACRAALADAGEAPGAITHLVTATCTGFSAPGWDIALVSDLPLPPSTKRTHVGFMGCHAAINALRVADALVKSENDARVLVCCTEICSVHFQYQARPDQAVANALFADGSAAVVLRAAPGSPSASDRKPLASIAAGASLLIPGTETAMGWRIGDHGFEMNLGQELPLIVRDRAAPWLRTWLDSQSLGIAAVRGWATHPGGPKILQALQEALDLPVAALQASRKVLAEHGNMSSPTVLFALEELRSSDAEIPQPCVVVSFGPGLTAEALLLHP